MKMFETMEQALVNMDTLIHNDPHMNKYSKMMLQSSLELFQEGLEIQSSFWFVIQNYLLQKSDKDPEAKDLLKTMKRMGIE
ncbi:hypothetical protein [Aeromonas jandaei]|uniref:hypothetical protein n=1 Tax=Aeromonas jandaei TaxID=650 RepID=UPI0011169BB4|nr:hypothetical protein [Aeromonas jandaei]TNH95143.1 hypothetical protein CF104_19985 [Aeromonas jandaei]